MKLSAIAKKMVLIIIIASAILIAAGAVLCIAVPSIGAAQILPLSVGILLSTLVSIIKVFMLEYQVARISKMDDPGKGKYFASGHGVLRFLLTGAGLLAAVFLPFEGYFAIYGAIAGAFTWNIAAYALRFVEIGAEDVAQDAQPQQEETLDANNNAKNE